MRKLVMLGPNCARCSKCKAEFVGGGYLSHFKNHKCEKMPGAAPEDSK